MNVLAELGIVVAGLVLALVLLSMNLWRSILFLFPSSVRVEPEAPADQMDLPLELSGRANQLQALGFVPLGSHEEKPRLQRATRSYDWAHPGERVFATLHAGQGGVPRLYLLTPLASGGFVITADYRRPALEVPGVYLTGSLEDAPPDRLLRAHLRRLDGLQPAGDFTWEGRVAAGRSWYQGLGRKEIRRQNLQGLLWTVIALAIVASAFFGPRAP
ncbi:MULTISPECIES: hypothetical protein [Myxococcus]|uniref:Uncharacterized protein n=1 Tax=Myxococcus xanthus TaxID=34 RepID=A0AAE6KUT2_MYXXA|nr:MULTISPECIES: hypothetical protein [Myxococcus]QDE70762.1 hypothetical protein BHS09_29415 [Myxococcus xanthus]QDE78041.1 hypothetical protein BHS08_29435 [Myxococcus xanthus]QDE85427.1 hypothetical protein BHS07_30020 [Myxococcus xanthus]QDE99584.1 hypothetical protein BHS05_29225 [Myxococcus xanthus]QDF07305.1 hypothetical protein BHS04_29535 [Myxococcus xanthus]